MVQRQILVPLESFGSRTYYSWGVWFKSILSGVIGALSERSQRAMPEDKVYVIFPVAKERSERLVEQIKSIYQSKRHVFTLEELEKTLKINYLKILVPLLPVTVFKVKGKCCLKFYTDEAEKKVNEVDLGILSLCSTIEYLNERMQIVSSNIKETHEKILEAFSSKSVAVHLLRRKKRFEKMLEQICKVQERLEEILTKIEQGKLSYEIFEVLQTGSSALNQMTDKVVVDQLYDLKESLTDVMDRYEEIESVGVLGADEPSEEEEEELRELLKRTKDGSLSPVELTADEAEIRDVQDMQEDELINELAQLSVVKEGELLEKVG
ncbi:uncharacterized protein LOC126330073 isoform X2 [Schistocerca gregaria]|uniref:uncharacterized protein LOC126330073 isoform X2 n=1 Tax=Schistocerca gregaria TaxID=7010 RepID=UPI00211DB1FB|nr:uncharacterized protein LOC126330073 isoform X2 [Schistocerca gregaria]